MYTCSYISGTFGQLDIRLLLQSARNAGLNLRISESSYSSEMADGTIFPKLGLVHLNASKRQLEILFKQRYPTLHFIEAECAFSTLNKTEDTLIEEMKINEEKQYTWGIEQTAVHRSKYTGKGVRIAILDTGIDKTHPDFSKANIRTTSFIDGVEPHDGNGHGTHCSGIIIGPKKTAFSKRYGVAPDAELFAGKVLSDSGSAHSRYVLEGMEWALAHKCRVISISLGNRMRKGMSFSLTFEKAAQAAIKNGALMIASAGNDSFRHLQRLLPVSEPANCPSIMAIGAINRMQEMYTRSNAGINPNGGNIELVAPGVSICSSYSSEKLYAKLSGTSMAASFVAGITAQYIEAFPQKTPLEIRALLCANALQLKQSKRDVGAGLVQAL